MELHTMSVYARFKKDPDGFRKLVELLESTPLSRRQKMIEVGMDEDSVYTKRALEYVLSFEDVIKLPEEELAEVCAKAVPKILAYALNQKSQEVKDRFLRCAPRGKAVDIRDLLDMKIGPREISGAEIKIVEVARALERQGLMRTKRIPPGT